MWLELCNFFFFFSPAWADAFFGFVLITALKVLKQIDCTERARRCSVFWQEHVCKGFRFANAGYHLLKLANGSPVI
jgi:hypothetical protein